MQTLEEADVGYLVRFDLMCPRSLDDSHNYLLLAAEKNLKKLLSKQNDVYHYLVLNFIVNDEPR